MSFHNLEQLPKIPTQHWNRQQPKLTKTGKSGQGFDDNFVEFCRVLAYLAAAPKGRRIGTEELMRQTGYTKQLRSLQRLLLRVSQQTLGLVANDGLTPRGWWLEADLGTVIKKIGEIQNPTTTGDSKCQM